MFYLKNYFNAKLIVYVKIYKQIIITDNCVYYTIQKSVLRPACQIYDASGTSARDIDTKKCEKACLQRSRVYIATRWWGKRAIPEQKRLHGNVGRGRVEEVKEERTKRKKWIYIRDHDSGALAEFRRGESESGESYQELPESARLAASLRAFSTDRVL